MQDDFQAGTASSQKSKTTPKTIEVIESFTDDEPTTAVTTETEPASSEPVPSVSEPANNDVGEVSDSAVSTDAENDAVDDEGPKKKFSWRPSWPPSKKEWGIAAAVLAVLISGGFGVFRLTHHSQPVVAKVVVKKPVATKAAVPTTVAAKLTGLSVAPDVNQRPVTGVMIENSLDARPQSGLDQAGVVFEAVAEGGVTRFFAVFQDTQPDYIGPVRSARPYYVQWCLSFDCSYAHVGGSPDGLAGIKSWGVKDLDQFANSGAYQRISSRYAPHNVYTSIGNLNSLEASKGYSTSNYSGFARKIDQPYKAPAPAATTTPANSSTKKTTTPAQDSRQPINSIDFTMSGYYYDPHFDYDAASNTYKRSEAGQPHMEQHSDGSQVQIAPKVVIGMVTPLSAGALDAQGAAYSNYQTIGTGDALIFQDGTVAKAHWSKPDIKSSISFTDDAGKPFKLNSGQTWITAITDAGKASYK